jgi:hemerythrin superfamily protein
VKAQAQDSLTDQMGRVYRLAMEHGEVDAAEWIYRRWSELKEEADRHFVSER